MSATVQPDVVILTGLPASGKTTYARKMAEEPRWARVNRDDLRSMLHDGKYSPAAERVIADLELRIVFALVSQGFSVVVDDTNLRADRREEIERVAREAGAVVGYVSFQHVDVEECIARDHERPIGQRVGSERIREMALTMTEPLPPPSSTPCSVRGCPDPAVPDAFGSIMIPAGELRVPLCETHLRQVARGDESMRLGPLGR